MVCEDGGGISADENLDGCIHTFGHYNNSCDLLGGADTYCNWCYCEAREDWFDGIC